MNAIQATVTIQVPDGYVLVENARLHELEEFANRGTSGDIKWLTEQLPFGKAQAIKRILTPFRQELEELGIAKYPRSKGQPYEFKKRQMLEWLDDNFNRY